MLNGSAIPAAIEGSEILINGQDIRPSGYPRIIDGIDGEVYPIDVKRRGKATIIEENNPKQRLVRDYSMLDIGSEINGQTLWGFSGDIVGPGAMLIGGNAMTGRHSGQKLNITGGCFMQLVNDWSNNTVLIHPKNDLLK